MAYKAQVLADSVSPDGVRLTTLEVTFPRFILAEFNTHRMFSRNSASSRAIPTEILIERVRTNPFIPETFNKRIKGMGVGETLEDKLHRRAEDEWRQAAIDAAYSAEKLMEIGIDKSRANRLLEPFLWHTVIVSATEWDNFFALRANPAAQPEMEIIARLMRSTMEMSFPRLVDYGEWHTPLAEAREGLDAHETTYNSAFVNWEIVKLLSASRCARVSYDRQHDDEAQEATIARANRLIDSFHLSPFEHVAKPMDQATVMPEIKFSGNFRGWVQMRKQIPNESNFGAVKAEV